MAEVAPAMAPASLMSATVAELWPIRRSLKRSLEVKPGPDLKQLSSPGGHWSRYENAPVPSNGVWLKTLPTVVRAVPV